MQPKSNSDMRNVLENKLNWLIGVNANQKMLLHATMKEGLDWLYKTKINIAAWACV